MLKQRLIFIAGILVALIPYSGFLSSWKRGFFVFLGLSIAFLAYLLYREKKMSQPQKNDHATFADNRDHISRIVIDEIKSPTSTE